MDHLHTTTTLARHLVFSCFFSWWTWFLDVHSCLHQIILALSQTSMTSAMTSAIDCHLEARNTCNILQPFFFENVPRAAMNKSEINEVRPKTPPREETRLKRLNLSIRFIDSCWRWRPWCQSAMLSLKLGWPGWPFLETWKADDAKICQRYQMLPACWMWLFRESLKFKKTPEWPGKNASEDDNKSNKSNKSEQILPVTWWRSSEDLNWRITFLSSTSIILLHKKCRHQACKKHNPFCKPPGFGDHEVSQLGATPQLLPVFTSKLSTFFTIQKNIQQKTNLRSWHLWHRFQRVLLVNGPEPSGAYSIHFSHDSLLSWHYASIIQIIFNQWINTKSMLPRIWQTICKWRINFSCSLSESFSSRWVNKWSACSESTSLRRFQRPSEPLQLLAAGHGLIMLFPMQSLHPMQVPDVKLLCLIHSTRLLQKMG